MPENADPNCTSWATVDFGKGPVDIRCTNNPGHKVPEDCMCVVFMVAPGQEPNLPSAVESLENAADNGGESNAAHN